MLPVIALVGRPNVGKSTLFNYLTRTRDALVADYPGLTRDRQYGRIKRNDMEAWVVDTGGLSGDETGIDAVAHGQVQRALTEADVVLLLVDCRDGLNPVDARIAGELRKLSKPVIVVANKIDGMDANVQTAEFHALGFDHIWPISAAHGRGIAELLVHVKQSLPDQHETPESDEEDGIRVAVVGRPNVGKSTLINRLLGEERVVVFDQPGTTRDSVFIPFERDGKRYTLIDTAGVRRRSRVSEAIEKFSIIQTLRAIDEAHVVIYLLDAQEGVTDQDASLLGMVLDSGRALVLGLNKWDGLTQDHKDLIRRQLEIKLGFLEYAEKYFVSALHGSGVGKMFEAIGKLYRSAMIDMSTSRLTAMLRAAVTVHQPPLVNGRRIKLKYAHQGGHNPPLIVIHGNQTQSLPGAYRRYLTNTFREKLQLVGTPIRLEFKSSTNPFEHKKPAAATRSVKPQTRRPQKPGKRGRE